MVSRRPPCILLNALSLTALLCIGPATAQEIAAPAELSIHRMQGAIVVDGDLSDEGWRDAQKVETWYETNPGDNVTPPVKNVGYMAYDDKFFYAALELQDPKPRAIRAPFGDRDNVPPYTDYAGVILDTRNTGKTAILFLANARGIQYDAVMDDSSGEDSSPDFFWDSAARIGQEGWVLEMRIPFSSLRYPKTDPQTWRITFYRVYPREHRYRMRSFPFERGQTCWLCSVPWTASIFPRMKSPSVSYGNF